MDKLHNLFIWILVIAFGGAILLGVCNWVLNMAHGIIKAGAPTVIAMIAVPFIPFLLFGLYHWFKKGNGSNKK